jgi:HAD superfamily hydrolase (TIGR01509 family)
VVLSGRSERFLDAIVFDLDGTIVDTETVEYESIRRVWAEHGANYELKRFEAVVGTTLGPDWVGDLTELLGFAIDHDGAIERRHVIRLELLAELEPREGIVELVEAAHTAGIPMGVASNSPLWWIEQRLDVAGLRPYMGTIVALDTSSAPKPHPAPFLEACAALGVSPRQAVAFEDSAPGVQSATAAGLYTVACPGPLTRNHDLSAADWVIGSHREIDLAILGRARRD